jgi:hypothetical protein
MIILSYENICFISFSFVSFSFVQDFFLSLMTDIADGATTLSIATLSIMTLSIIGFLRHSSALWTLIIKHTQHNSTLPLCRVSCLIYCYAECHYPDYHSAERRGASQMCEHDRLADQHSGRLFATPFQSQGFRGEKVVEKYDDEVQTFFCSNHPQFFFIAIHLIMNWKVNGVNRTKLFFFVTE